MNVLGLKSNFIKENTIIEEHIFSYIDTVNGRLHGEGDILFFDEYIDKIEIKGWAVNCAEHELFQGNYICINDTVFVADKVVLRNDVARAHNNSDYIRSGFLFEIDGKAFSLGDNELQLFHYSKTKQCFFAGKKITVTLNTPQASVQLKDKSVNELIKLIENKDALISRYYYLLKTKDTHIDLISRSLTWRLNQFLFYPLNYLKNKKVKKQVETLSMDVAYQMFLENNKLKDEDISSYKKKCTQFKFKPKISLVVPVYNVNPYYLQKCVDSVKNQIYQNWELCLYDDASTDVQTIKCLHKIASSDKRIKVGFGKVNGHISVATNSAIEMATGEFIGLLDNDDELTVDALFSVVEVLNGNNEYDLIYSDEDKLEMDGTRSHPYFKCNFNKELLLSNNYICHFTVIRKSLGDSIGWFRKGFEGSQDHDLFLRIADVTSKIHHIPKVLYHWRMIPGSTAAEFSDKSYAQTAGINALKDYLSRNKEKGVVTAYNNGTYRVKREIVHKKKVSIIIPFKDQVEVLKVCLQSIFEKTDYSNYELILVSNNSKDPETFAYLNSVSQNAQNIKWFEFNEPFNYSRINNWAVQKASGDYILLLNNDVEVITNEWLSSMVEHIQRPSVGAVGAKLLYFDNTVQHAGVIIGLGEVAGHSHKYYSDDDAGYFFRASVVQELSACTAACLLVKKDAFLAVGGLNEVDLTVAFNDVDLCLKIRAAGYKIIYTPYAKLYHYESKSRGFEDTPEKIARFESEVNYMKANWRTHEICDEYYSPNLSKVSEDFFIKTN